VKKLMNMIKRPEKYVPVSRRLTGEVIVEGQKSISMVMNSNVTKVESIMMTEEALRGEHSVNILGKLKKSEIPVYLVDQSIMKMLSDTKTPQGIVSVCTVNAHGIERIKLSAFEMIVVSDGIQDPGNMGTLVRVCDAAGLRYFLVMRGSVNPFHPKAIRSSAGSVFNIKIVFADSEDFLKWCHRQKISIVTTSVNAEMTIYEYIPDGRVALVFGNESSGVNEKILRTADCDIRIPIYGRAESLNVASAAAITVYEMVNKRLGKPS
jgi:TrmH family RNA methyltransferase